MNKANFVKWFKEQLLKSLKQPSIVVMDNASYHSTVINKAPTAAWSKAAIQN
ncbi:hypothetical protein ILUMI_23819, partial [Ignelater luminosus]